MKITFDEKTAAKIKALGDVDLVFDFDHTLSGSVAKFKNQIQGL